MKVIDWVLLCYKIAVLFVDVCLMGFVFFFYMSMLDLEPFKSMLFEGIGYVLFMKSFNIAFYMILLGFVLFIVYWIFYIFTMIIYKNCLVDMKKLCIKFSPCLFLILYVFWYIFFCAG